MLTFPANFAYKYWKNISVYGNLLLKREKKNIGKRFSITSFFIYGHLTICVRSHGKASSMTTTVAAALLSVYQFRSGAYPSGTTGGAGAPGTELWIIGARLGKVKHWQEECFQPTRWWQYELWIHKLFFAISSPRTGADNYVIIGSGNVIQCNQHEFFKMFQWFCTCSPVFKIFID